MSTPKVLIEFTIWANSFEPSEVTKLMGITPTKQDGRHRGYDPETQEYVYESYWQLNEERDAWSVEECLRPLMERLVPKKEQILEIEKRFEATVRVYFVLSPNGTNGPGMFLSSDVLQFFADLNASFDVDIQSC